MRNKLYLNKFKFKIYHFAITYTYFNKFLFNFSSNLNSKIINILYLIMILFFNEQMAVNSMFILQIIFYV